MNEKGMIIILEAKSFFIPFSKALQERGLRAGEPESERREEKGEWGEEERGKR